MGDYRGGPQCDDDIAARGVLTQVGDNSRKYTVVALVARKGEKPALRVAQVRGHDAAGALRHAATVVHAEGGRVYAAEVAEGWPAVASFKPPVRREVGK